MISITNGKVSGFIGQDKIYIGRGNRYYNLSPSPLNNPFPINSQRNREQSIAEFRLDLWKSIKLLRDKGVVNSQMQELIRIAKLERQLGKVNLVCWCKPQLCHGDVIVAALNWLGDQYWFNELV